jgi:hypothetical protein
MKSNVVKASVKKLVSEVTTINETSLSLVPARKGAYDKAVEIFVGGEIIPTYLSQVRVGQPWHPAEGSKAAEWFVCISPIKIDYSRDSKNPTFIMGAINVLQAAPIEELLIPSKPQTPVLETVNTKTLRLTSSSLDVTDVDVK